MKEDKIEKSKKISATAIANIAKSLQKKFGDSNVNFLGNKAIAPMPRITSQSPSIDKALGGGWPLGKMVELFGPESSGKSTICYHAMAEAQKQGMIVGLIDTEYSFDPQYAQQLGIDPNAVIISQPDDGTTALEILLDMLANGVTFIVVDSIAALLPREEALEESLAKASVARQAALMSKALRKITPACGQANALIMFTNQTREKVGVMYGNPETTPGGLAMKFYASIRVRVNKLSGDKTTDENGDLVSTRTKLKVVKNKTAPPFREAEFTIKFGTGIDSFGDLIETVLDSHLFTKAGGGNYISEIFKKYTGDEKMRGRDTVIKWLTEKCKEDNSFFEMLKAESQKVEAKVSEPEENESSETELDASSGTV